MKNYVYFIQAGKQGPIKIGASIDPKSRLAALQTANYETLRLIGIHKTDRCEYAVEEEMHRTLVDSHIRGEWFRPTKEVFALIRKSANVRVKRPTLSASGTQQPQAQPRARIVKLFTIRTKTSPTTIETRQVVEQSLAVTEIAPAAPAAQMPLTADIDEQQIKETLASVNGHIGKAAYLLGWPRWTLRERLKHFGIIRPSTKTVVPAEHYL